MDVHHRGAQIQQHQIIRLMLNKTMVLVAMMGFVILIVQHLIEQDVYVMMEQLQIQLVLVHVLDMGEFIVGIVIAIKI